MLLLFLLFEDAFGLDYQLYFYLAKSAMIGYNFLGGNMKIKNDFILKQIAGSYIVVPVRQQAVDFSGIIKLSETGAFLWRLLENGVDREELIAKLLDEYLVDEDVAGEDVDRFIAQLNEADLLE